MYKAFIRHEWNEETYGNGMKEALSNIETFRPGDEVMKGECLVPLWPLWHFSSCPIVILCALHFGQSLACAKV
jgi:hypothetical protein